MDVCVCMNPLRNERLEKPFGSLAEGPLKSQPSPLLPPPQQHVTIHHQIPRVCRLPTLATGRIKSRAISPTATAASTPPSTARRNRIAAQLILRSIGRHISYLARHLPNRHHVASQFAA